MAATTKGRRAWGLVAVALGLACGGEEAGQQSGGSTGHAVGSSDGADDGGDDGTSDGADDGGSADLTDGADGGTDDGGPAADCVPVEMPIPDGFHVAPDGAQDGDGSAAAPWDAATAFAHPEAVQPGDIVYLHEGTYPAVDSRLEGAEDMPIVVRSYPGEWATFDGADSDEDTFTVTGNWVVMRDFEIMNSDPNRTGSRPGGYTTFGHHIKLINLIVHDTGGNGFWSSSVDSEMYGNIIYANGYDDDDRAHGHGMYTQNAEGTKRIADNILFNGYSFGIHAYTEGGSIQGFEVEGNVMFQNGAGAIGSGEIKDDCLIGGGQPAARVTLRDNYSWSRGIGERSVRLGYGDPNNEDATLEGNYFAGRMTFAQPWQTVTMTDNEFLGGLVGLEPTDYPDNVYGEGVAPTSNAIFVRENWYEPGRAHIIVYNFEDLDRVDVVVTGLVQLGAEYSIVNVQDYFGEPVAQGIYDGNPIELDMSALATAQPLGSPDAVTPDEQTGRGFGVFVLRAQRCQSIPGE